MRIELPEALLLMLPALAVVAWIVVWRGVETLRLPGHWHRLIDAPMQRFMAGRVVSPGRVPWPLWLAVWTLLVVGLARPVIGSATPADYGNLAGRVIAMDLGADADIEEQKLLVYRILDAAPATPTALVVATAEAFAIVPFTTDRAYFKRYLDVLGPEVMPVEGRALGIAITHSESVLDRAGLAVGQLVLLTGGQPPQPDTQRAGDWLRAIVVETDSDAWEGYANAVDARLSGPGDLDNLIDDLDRAVADALRDGNPTGDFELAPWLIACAGLLWLVFFRRIRTA